MTQILGFNDKETLRRLMVKYHESRAKDEERTMLQQTSQKGHEFWRGRQAAHLNMVEYWQNVSFDPTNAMLKNEQNTSQTET